MKSAGKMRLFDGDALLGAAIHLDRHRCGHGVDLKNIAAAAEDLERFVEEFMEGEKKSPDSGAKKGVVEGIRAFRCAPTLTPKQAYELLPREIRRFKRIAEGGPIHVRERVWLTYFCLQLHRAILADEHEGWMRYRRRSPFIRHAA